MEPNDQNVGYLLNKAALKLKWELNNKLLSYDITAPQWAVLRYLYAEESIHEQVPKITPAQVAEQLLTDRPTISGIIERLSNKGYIRTEPNPADRRSLLLHLTKEAKSLIPQLEKESRNTLEKSLKGLTQEQTDQFKELLMTVIRNLEHDDQ